MPHKLICEKGCIWFEKKYVKEYKYYNQATDVEYGEQYKEYWYCGHPKKMRAIGELITRCPLFQSHLFKGEQLIRGEKKMSPLVKTEPFVRYPKISLKEWKNKESKTFTFTDEGKDIQTPSGLAYLYLVIESGETKELWIRPNSPLAIALSPHVPLKDKTFKATKKTGAQQKDTRYIIEEKTG